MHTLLLFFTQPFSYVYIWRHKKKHDLFYKFLILNGIWALLILVLSYLGIQTLTAMYNPLYLEVQKQIHAYFYLIITLIALMSMGFGLIIRNKKITHTLKVAVIVFSILVPNSLNLITTFVVKSGIMVTMREFNHSAQSNNLTPTK